ncbi:MAG: DUF2939 domain-containing protein [Asticcacaulis sp.]
MLKLLSLTIVLLIAGALAAFAIGPVWAFYDLRSAAESEDIKSLSELVAFDDVRTSLRNQLLANAAGQTTASAPPPSVLKDPVGALGSAIGKAITDMTAPPALKTAAVNPDAYLTPRALLALSYGAGKSANTADPKSLITGKPPLPKVLYWSIDRARLGVAHPDTGQTVFSMKRRGLFSWQVTHIGLPNPETAPVSAPETPTSASPVE